jgi:hypothetical protein
MIGSSLVTTTFDKNVTKFFQRIPLFKSNILFIVDRSSLSSIDLIPTVHTFSLLRLFVIKKAIAVLEINRNGSII